MFLKVCLFKNVLFATRNPKDGMNYAIVQQAKNILNQFKQYFTLQSSTAQKPTLAVMELGQE
jgi:hypothetical protein